jgi:hypothetical protein
MAVMIMVSGPSRKQRTKYADHPRFGWLLNPRAGASVETIVQSGMLWACDNDCFKQLHRRAYLRMLRRVSGQPRLQWVAAPDVVGDARATLLRFRLWAPVLRHYKLPVAFVAQDGQERLPVPWDEIRCLFIGGSTAWKMSMHAARLIEEAAARYLWVHVGRISTFDRLDRFDSLPVTSFDTTAVCHKPAHLDRFLARTDYQQQAFLHGDLPVARPGAAG